MMHHGALQVALTVGPVNRLFGVIITNPHLWSPADPFLYDVVVSLISTPPQLLQGTAFFAISASVRLATKPVARGSFCVLLYVHAALS